MQELPVDPQLLVDPVWEGPPAPVHDAGGAAHHVDAAELLSDLLTEQLQVGHVNTTSRHDLRSLQDINWNDTTTSTFSQLPDPKYD